MSKYVEALYANQDLIKEFVEVYGNNDVFVKSEINKEQNAIKVTYLSNVAKSFNNQEKLTWIEKAKNDYRESFIRTIEIRDFDFKYTNLGGEYVEPTLKYYYKKFMSVKFKDYIKDEVSNHMKENFDTITL